MGVLAQSPLKKRKINENNSGDIKIIKTYFFWDIENVSFHNLDRIMKQVHESEGEMKLYAVFSKIKEARKVQLLENGWILIDTGNISKNSADFKIKEMIFSILENKTCIPEKIFLITEDKGFYKISQRIIMKGIHLEVICGTKSPQWIRTLKQL